MSDKLPKRWAINGCEADFAFVCPKTWGKLKKGDDPNVRFCDDCKKNVYLVKTREELEAKRNERCCVAARDTYAGWLIGDVGPDYFLPENSRRRKRDRELAMEPEASWPEWFRKRK